MVVVGPPASSSGGPAPSVPARYMEYDKSGLAFTVEPKPDNTYPVVIDRK